MPITYVQGQSGKVYPFNISGVSPNQTEQQKINEVLVGLGDASAAPVAQEEEAGIVSGFKRGLDRGIRQTGALLGDALPAVAADLIGADEYRDRQLDEYQETMEAINREAPSFVPTYKDIEDLGDASVYAAETIGQFVPSILTSIAGGGIGGFVGKKAAEKFAKKLVGDAAKKAAQKGTKIGFVSGAFAGSGSQTIPEVYTSVFEETGEKNAALALVMGSVNASLDAILPVALVGRLTKKARDEVARGVVARLFIAGGKGFVTEGLTEGIQESNNILAAKIVDENIDFFSGDNVDRIMEAGIRGAIGGKAIGLVGGFKGESPKQAQKRLESEALQDAGALGSEIQADLAASEKKQAGLAPDEAVSQAVARQGLNLEKEAAAQAKLQEERNKIDSGNEPVNVSQLPDAPENNAQLTVGLNRQGLQREQIDTITPAELREYGLTDLADQIQADQLGALDSRPENRATARRTFSQQQYDAAAAKAKEDGEITIEGIQEVAKTKKGKPVTRETAEKIRDEMIVNRVVAQTSPNKFDAVSEEELQTDPAQPLRNLVDEQKRKISRLESDKKKQQETEEKILEIGDLTTEQEAALLASRQQRDQIEKTLLAARAEARNIQRQVDTIDSRTQAQGQLKDQKFTQEDSNLALAAAREASKAEARVEYQQKEAGIVRQLKKDLGKLVGKGAGVNLATDFVISDDGGGRIIEGSYRPYNKLITLAMGIYDPSLSQSQRLDKLRGVLNHEVIHALRDAGLFTQKEFDVLKNAASKRRFVVSQDGELVERNYTFLDRAKQINKQRQNESKEAYNERVAEEAVAEMFRAWADGKLKVAGRPLTLFQRIVNFFKRVQDVHSAAGFSRVEDIFKDIQSGKVGQRKAGMSGMVRSRSEIDADQSSVPVSEVDRLPNLPTNLIGPVPVVNEAKAKYLASVGMPNRRQSEYVKVDQELATKIANAYEEAENTPFDPNVQAAYKAMAEETMAQWQFVKDTGIEIEFIRGPNPYPGGSRDVLEDIKNNNHLFVFATKDGFGQSEITEQDIAENPMLADSGEIIDGEPATINDIFRIVHDYFGHGLEGTTFTARGEENAWQAHHRMYSPLAAQAMTSETRGQNSWVNFGPFGEQNRADRENTVYAPQKLTILPSFAMEEGIASDFSGLPIAQEKQRGRQELREGIRQPDTAGDGRVVSGRSARDGRRETDLGVEGQAVQRGVAGEGAPQTDEDGLVTLTHFSEKSELQNIDPLRQGSNFSIRGEEGIRRKMHGAGGRYGDIYPPRSYFGLEVGQEGGYIAEWGVGKNRYETKVPLTSLYDIKSDPDGFRTKAREIAERDVVPFSEQSRAAETTSLQLSILEKMINDAGYVGYWSDSSIGRAAAIFRPTDVKKFSDPDAQEAFTENLTDEDQATVQELSDQSRDQAIPDDADFSSLPPEKPLQLALNPIAKRAAIKGNTAAVKNPSLFGLIKDNLGNYPVVLMAGQDKSTGYKVPFLRDFGLHHMLQRNHLQEFLDSSKYTDLEQPIYDVMQAWAKQGYRDGPDVVSEMRVRESMRLTMDSPPRKSPPIVVDLQFIPPNRLRSGDGIYTVATAFPRLREKNRRIVDQSSLPVDFSSTHIRQAQNSIVYAKSYDVLKKALNLVTLGSEQTAEKAANTFGDLFQDRFLPIAQVVDRLRAQGATIDDAFDPYLQESLYHGRVGNRIEEAKNALYEPAANKVKELDLDAGTNYEGLAAVSQFVRDSEKNTGSKRLAVTDAYLYALHAKERNEYIRSINEGEDAGSGMRDSEADAIINWVNGLDAKNRQVLESVRSIVRDIVADTNKVRVEGGLIPEDFNTGQIDVNEQGEKVDAPNFKEYVPLRGILDPEGEASEDGSFGAARGQTFSIRGKEDRRMLGRYEYATSILAGTFMQNQNAVIRSEKNAVGQSFLRLIRSQPELMSKTAVELQSPPMRRGLVEGAVKMMYDFQAKNDDSILVVKEGGQEILIKTLDPRVAKALKGATGVSNETLSGIVRGFGKVNRYLSNINTTYNPEFLITNLVRDIQTAGVNVNQYEIEGLTKEIMKNYGSSFKGVKDVVRGMRKNKQTGQPELPSNITKEMAEAAGFDINKVSEADVFRLFQIYGGQNSLNTMDTLQDQLNGIKGIVGDIAESGARGKWNSVKNSFVGKGAGSLLNLLDDYNTVVENAIRVSTFKSLAPKIGFEKAAFAARNVTVDFAKGGEFKPFMNSVYLFYNASLQGSFALINAATRSPKVRKIWVSTIMAGIAFDQLNAFFSDEDEDGELVYDKAPEYILEHNILLPLGGLGPSERSHLSIPLPYGLNIGYNLGRALSRSLRGGYDIGEATSSIFMTAADALNPLGGTNNFYNFAAPTIADPFVDIMRNEEEFSGRPIVKETSPFDPTPPPNSQLFWSTTSPSLKWVTENVNKATGGSEFESGLLDFSPDIVDYWLNYLTGGAGMFVNRTVDFTTQTMPKALSEGFEDEFVRQTPFLRKVFYSVSEREDVGGFIENRNKVLKAREVLEETIKLRDPAAIRSVRERYAKELSVFGQIRAVNSARNRILRKLRQVDANQNLTDDQKEKITERLRENLEVLIQRGNRIMGEADI
jgi:hypothetical protein